MALPPDVIPVSKMPSDVIPVNSKMPADVVPVNRNSAIQNIQQHPVKAVFSPLAETLSGKSFENRAFEATKPLEINPNDPFSYWSAVVKNAGSGMVGAAADIATTPASYIPIPGAKLLGKIPIRGTTLGKIAMRVPIGKGFVEQIDKMAAKPIVDVVKGELTPTAKIIDALKGAQDIRDAQELLYTAERAKRFGAIEAVGKKIPGEAGYHAQLSKLKGELPKFDFTGIRNMVSQEDIDSVFAQIERSALTTPEKISAKNGMARLLGAEGGLVPRQSEIDLLREVFPGEFIDTVLSKRPLIEQVGDQIAEVLNVPRALMASFDMSAPLRQGIFFIGRPKQFFPAFKEMFKYFGSEKAYDGLMENIRNRSTYKWMRESKLPLTDINAGLSGREEKFMSNLVERLPILRQTVGQVTKASGRAYTGFLTKLRADVFDDLVSRAPRTVDADGAIHIDKKVLDNISEFVGAATGRGKMPKSLEKAAVALNSVFFSPRLMASRMTLMNPQFYIKLDPFTRKEALKDAFTMATTASTILGLAAAGGAKVGHDPRSSDFGKIKVDNTRYDILGGFQQYIRFIYQFVSGERVSSSTGVKTTVGEGYRSENRVDILARFLQSKEAPALSFFMDFLRGKDFTGQDINVSQEIYTRFIPMVIQDAYDLYKDRGASGVAMDIPAIFGVGVQTYSPDAAEMVYSAKSAVKYAKKLIGEGRAEEARKIMDDNKEIIAIAKPFIPVIDHIKKLEGEVERLKKRVDILPEQKAMLVNKYQSQINEMKKKMDDKFTQIMKPRKP